MPLSIDKTTYRSKNHSPRPQGTVIDAIVLHDGEGSKKSDLERLTDDSVPMEDRVSAHYYVDRQGRTYELVDPLLEAWHAGKSNYQGRTNWNPFSIGIETEHKRGQDWPIVQKAAIRDLCMTLIARFPIKEQYVAAHKWIAPGRKPDPTDWTDEDLHAFIDSLFTGPANNFHLTGLDGDKLCGKGFYDFYIQHGGFVTFGYALTNETPDIDILGRKCTWMRFERAIFKYVEGEGAHLALLSEAQVKHWIT